MGNKRYPLASLKISGERCVSFIEPSPRWMRVALGLAVIPVGLAAFSIAQQVEGARTTLLHIMGAVFVIAGLASLLYWSYFVLDPDRRVWRVERIIAGFRKVTQGDFDEAAGIQVVSMDPDEAVWYAVIWRWRDERHRARLLDWSRDYVRAREKWLALGRELRVPLVEWRGSELVVVEPDAAPLSPQISTPARNISTLSIPDPPPGVRVRVERSAGRVVLFLPLSTLAKGLWAMLGVALLFEIIIFVPFIALFLHHHYEVMLWLAFPIAIAACVGIVLQVMTQRVIELRDEEIRLRRRFGVGILRPRRIPYCEIIGIHRAPLFENNGFFVLVTTSRGYNLGQGLKVDGRDWLVSVLRRAMGAPGISSTPEGRSGLEAT